VIDAPHGLLVDSPVFTNGLEVECSKTERIVIWFPFICAPIPSGIPLITVPAKRSPAVARTFSETALEEGSKYVGFKLAANELVLWIAKRVAITEASITRLFAIGIEGTFS
jgi:hypothetical protein